MRTENLKNSVVAAKPVIPFRELISRVREGDRLACETLVQEYGAVILREARIRLGAHYTSFLDADDVVQSVLRSFLLRAGEGRFQLHEPAQLVRLLTRMARNKAFTALRREARRKAVISIDDLTDVADSRGTSDESASTRELIEIYRRRMGAEEWQLLQWRLEGETWPAIARRTQEAPETLRKRLQRELEHLRRTLPLE